MAKDNETWTWEETPVAFLTKADTGHGGFTSASVTVRTTNSDIPAGVPERFSIPRVTAANVMDISPLKGAGYSSTNDKLSMDIYRQPALFHQMMASQLDIAGVPQDEFFLLAPHELECDEISTVRKPQARRFVPSLQIDLSDMDSTLAGRAPESSRFPSSTFATFQDSRYAPAVSPPDEYPLRFLSNVQNERSDRIVDYTHFCPVIEEDFPMEQDCELIDHASVDDGYCSAALPIIKPRPSSLRDGQRPFDAFSSIPQLPPVQHHHEWELHPWQSSSM